MGARRKKPGVRKKTVFLYSEHFLKFLLHLGGVYMRKLALAQVSYRDDFFISYRVYVIVGHFISQLFEGTLHVDEWD